MALQLGVPHAHRRSVGQQQEIREARKMLKEKVKGDWEYPPLPQFQSLTRESEDVIEDDEQMYAGFKLHRPSNHERDALADGVPAALDFEPADWCEREYSSEELSEREPDSAGSKTSTFKFEGPDSVGTQIEDGKAARKRKRQQLLDEEVTWNDGLAHWMARRDIWCGAHTSTQVQRLDSMKDAEADAQNETGSTSASASAASTPPTSSSSSSAAQSPIEGLSSPSSTTTPELNLTITLSPTGAPQIMPTQPDPPSEMLLPVAPTLLPTHPIRRRITPEIYPEIYSKIILQSRSPSIPINLRVIVESLVQGWKADGEWPPKQGVLEKAIGRRKGRKPSNEGGESTLKSGLKAVTRVLRITSASGSRDGQGTSTSREKEDEKRGS